MGVTGFAFGQVPCTLCHRRRHPCQCLLRSAGFTRPVYRAVRIRWSEKESQRTLRGKESENERGGREGDGSVSSRAGCCNGQARVAPWLVARVAPRVVPRTKARCPRRETEGQQKREGGGFHSSTEEEEGDSKLGGGRAVAFSPLVLLLHSPYLLPKRFLRPKGFCSSSCSSFSCQRTRSLSFSLRFSLIPSLALMRAHARTQAHSCDGGSNRERAVALSPGGWFRDAPFAGYRRCN